MLRELPHKILAAVTSLASELKLTPALQAVVGCRERDGCIARFEPSLATSWAFHVNDLFAHRCRFMYVYVHVYVDIHRYTCTYSCTDVYVHVYVDTHRYTCTYSCTDMCTCIQVCMRIPHPRVLHSRSESERFRVKPGIWAGQRQQQAQSASFMDQALDVFIVSFSRASSM